MGNIDLPTATLELTNNWRHMCIVCPNGANAKLYVDGEYQGDFTTANINTSAFNDIDECILGGDLDASGGAITNDFNGRLGEFRFYKTALTADNVRSLYNFPSGPGTQGTKISGDMITAGSIKSNNWASSAGSQIDLNNGTIKLGGSSDPDFEVSSDGHMTAKGGGNIAGWTISDTTLANGSNIVLDHTNKRISLNDATFGNAGVQLEYTSGGGKFHAGDGTKFFKWDGSNVSISGSDFSLSTAGDVTASNAYFDGDVMASALRSEALVLDSTNAVNYIQRQNYAVTINGTSTTLQRTKIDLSGALNGGGHKQYSHVIIDLDMYGSDTGTAQGTSCNHFTVGTGASTQACGMIYAIIPPKVPGTDNRVNVTVEVKSTRTVKMFLDKTDTTGFNAIYASSPSNTSGVAVAPATFMSA